MVIDALRDRFAVIELYAQLGTTRSSYYYYARVAAVRKDSHAGIRVRVREICKRSKTAFEGFARKLDGYIEFYNGQRKKKSLGWMSPKDYRLSLGFAA